MKSIFYFGLLGFSTATFLSSCMTTGTNRNASAVKVINGIEINESNYPGVVKLNNDAGMCTGTFVNDTTVITAAHCVDMSNPQGGVTVSGIPSINVFFSPTYRTLRNANNGNYRMHDRAVLVFPEGTAGQLGIFNFIDVAPTGIQVNQQFVILGFGVTDMAGTQGGGTLRLGANTVSQRDGEGILFQGTSSHPLTPTGENVSSGGGDSGGPMLNAAGQLVGTTQGGGPQNGGARNLYITSTSPNARALYSSAIQCNTGSCAKNFVGSGVGGGGGEVCGQASQNTHVCINASRTVVTITNGGREAQYHVALTGPSQLLSGGTKYQGVANLTFIAGMTSTQQVSFIIHPSNIGKLVSWNSQSWIPFGGVNTFALDNGGGVTH